MVEYYKTQKGYCYKKTQKGGSKRISNKDYEKKTKLKGGGTDLGKTSSRPKINITQKQKPPPPPQDELKLDELMNDINLNSNYNKITEEINKYITNYEISVTNVPTVPIVTKETTTPNATRKVQRGGNKRKKKNQKGGVDLNLLLKKLKCFGNTDGSKNDKQSNTQEIDQNAIQDIKNVYNHMKDKYKYTINQLQENATLPSDVFEKLSKDIMAIPDFDSTAMINLIESDYNNYIKHNCNTNQQPQQLQNNTNQQPQQLQNPIRNFSNIYNSSDVFKLVIALCVLIVNKLNLRILPTIHVNKKINEITVFGYVVYLLALLFLKILKEMKRITIIEKK